MPYQMTENGNIVAKDGMPIFDDNGTETLVDRDAIVRSMQAAMSESKNRKIKLKEQQETLDKFAEFSELDPEVLREALEVKNNLDEKQLIAAGEKDTAVKQATEGLEKRYQTMVDSYNGKVTELTDKLGKTKSDLHNQIVNRVVVDSPFLATTTMTPDVKQLVFGPSFKIENINGTPTPVAYYSNGEAIHSLEKMGDYASPEEALKIMWDKYPHKGNYTPGGPPGSGTVGNSGKSPKIMYSSDEWALVIAKTTDRLERASLFKQLRDGTIQVK